MKAAIVISLILFLLVGAGAAALVYFIRRTDPKSHDNTERAQLKNAQEFLPFEDIRDDMILLGGHRYRAVLACTSTNYQLKTSAEREQIELSFQRFLNSVNFPITFFLQTKVIDNTTRLEDLKRDLSRTTAQFPNITAYADQYLNDMAHLNERLGNNQQKRRYIIVTYDNADELSTLTEEEKIIHAAKEVRLRCQSIQSNLEAVGVNSHIMETHELIELIYSSYHRDDYSYAEAIAEKAGFSLFAHGEQDRFEDLPKAKLTDLILGEAINQMQLENIDADAVGKDIVDQLRGIREKYAGYFCEGGARE